MRILIIERDADDTRYLKNLLREVAPEKKVIGICTTCRQVTEWFENNAAPDLIFSVVQLSDGLSFDVFKKLPYNVPVIFTCAYNKYALDAFKANGIHYLLKPIKKEELCEALNRYETYFSPRLRIQTKDLPASHQYQERFMISVGNQMKLINAEDIAYFFTLHKIVYMVTFDGNKYVTSFNLEGLEKILTPKMFFRINRQFIINHSCIVKLIPASKSRLQLSLNPPIENKTFTSFGRTKDFRKWLLGKG